MATPCTEPTADALRSAIAGIENKDAWDWSRDPQELQRLHEELDRIEAAMPQPPKTLERLRYEERFLRDERLRYFGWVLRLLGSLRNAKEGDYPEVADEMMQGGFGVELVCYRRLHGQTCRRLREVQAEIGARTRRAA